MSARTWEPVVLLLLFVIAPALGFRGEALRRSTIPVALDHQVLDKNLQTEKKPPVDDACRLLLQPREGGPPLILRVDHAVFDAVAVGDALAKGAGDEELHIGDRRLGLQASPDADGARRVLAVAWVIGLVAIGRRLLRGPA